MKILIIILAISATIFASDTVSINGLEWQDNSEAKTTKLNWSDAKAHCQNLSLGGYEDWRLPTIQELQSIVDIGKKEPTIKRRFNNVTSSVYWSSSEGVSDAKYAWVVGFGYGNTNGYAKSNEYSVRCVRARQ